MVVRRWMWWREESLSSGLTCKAPKSPSELGFRVKSGLGQMSGFQEEEGWKRGWWSGGNVVAVAAMSLALSSANASQKALWVMKVSFLQSRKKWDNNHLAAILNG